MRPLAEYLNLLYLSHKYFYQPVFSLNIITILLAILLLFLNFLSHRFWCRNLCPLGGLLAFLSRFSVIKRQVGPSCNSCMKCHSQCPMGAIQDQPQETREEECIECSTCSRVCPQSAVSFKVPTPLFLRTRPQINLTKRGLFLSAGAGVLAVLSHRTDPVSKNTSGKLIRPPGSLPENLFLQLCIRCGQCMKICPNNALHPALDEAGIEGLWTPILVPATGYCEPTCTLCSQVCPTAAIRRVSEDEKLGKNGARMVSIGTAFFDRGRCLPWAMGTPCTVCEEFCPTSPKAILMKEEEVEVLGRRVKLKVPYLDPSQCNGCGACEYVCPVHDKAAIRVTCSGESRSRDNQLLLGKPARKKEKPEHS